MFTRLAPPDECVEIGEQGLESLAELAVLPDHDAKKV
jgi:hypothetical protein